MMTDLFRKQWRQLQSADHSLDVNHTVTLASLVEKETAVPGERPLVASVFANRLRARNAARLRSDHDLRGAAGAALSRRPSTVRIWRARIAYNTYRHTGLPPGPIANPGVAALKAALAPASSRLTCISSLSRWLRRPSVLENHRRTQPRRPELPARPAEESAIARGDRLAPRYHETLMPLPESASTFLAGIVERLREMRRNPASFFRKAMTRVFNRPPRAASAREVVIPIL